MKTNITLIQAIQGVAITIPKIPKKCWNTSKPTIIVTGCSFIGWHILAIFTLGILEIWVIPYQTTATTKFLNDIKVSNE